MSGNSRERRLTAAFVTLADTLVADYDVAELLQTLVDTCADVLDADAVGLMLADQDQALAIVASTSENSLLAGLMESESGPSVGSFRTGVLVEVIDVETYQAVPGYSATARSLGFRSVHAVPMRLRGKIIGALTLFRSDLGPLSSEDAAVTQGLADVATIGVLHERALRESGIVQEQLQEALESRVIIEQAKGVIAQQRAVDMDSAFRALRDHARSKGLTLRNVAELVVARSITV